jgi:aldehyde:ferredoxin oxidoreductase
MTYGYAGKLLRVDLSEDKLSEEKIDEKILRDFVGASGLSIKVIYDEVPPGVDAFDPENRLVIASGVFGGTALPATGTVTVASKSPVTSFFAKGSGNGWFGAKLRFAGYDAIVFQGASDKPTYLSVKDGESSLGDAEDLWGKDTVETENQLKRKLGDPDASVMCIGPAGENLVRFACPMNDGGHTASSGGNGAVMGSKKLKAVVVSGKGKVPVKNKEKLPELSKRWIAYISETPGVKRRNAYGTAGSFPGEIEMGTLPIKNLITAEFPDWVKLSGETIRSTKTFKFTPRPCYRCPLKHAQTMEITEGKYKGFVGEEPEYECLAGFGSNLGIGDVEEATILSDLNDRLGMDVKESSWCISLAIECYEKGILTDTDTESLKLRWGEAEGAKMLLRKIAKREGLGNILAEGVKRAGYRIGGDVSKYAVYFKGYGPHLMDYRGDWGLIMGSAVSEVGSIMGGAHADPELGLRGPYPRWPVKDLPMLVAKSGDKREFGETLGTCGFTRGMPLSPIILEALEAVTGRKFSLEEALTVGERIINLARAFNIRHGLKPEDDEISPRHYEPPPNGAAKGVTIEPYYNGMLLEYYRIRGWDEKTGKPLRSTLKRLGLDYAAKDIWD